MAVVVAILFTVCMTGTGIGSFKFDVGQYRDPVTNATRYRTTLTDFYLGNRYLFDAIFEITFNAVVPTTY
nr:hypothetical protein BaRGS_000639 [Batillaria attramentaria]